VSRTPAEVLRAVGSPRVVVVGDLLVDRYVTGRVDRLSPEAPVPVLAVESDERRLGGAGSVAHDLAVLGARATLVGVLGEDAEAETFRAAARGAGIALEAVVDGARPTSLKTRHLAHTHSTPQQVLRVDREVTRDVEGAVERSLLAALDRALAGADAALVSDYRKGLLTPAVLARVAAWSKRTGKPSVVDPKREDLEAYAGATGIKPNRAQAARVAGHAIETEADARRAAESILERFGFDFVLVTLDRDGMALATRGGGFASLRTAPREVFDVTGAGDMVLAVLGLVLGSNGTPAEAAALANVAAGLEVEKVGVVPIPREEIAARLAGDGGVPADRKLVDRPAAAGLARRLREAGRRIVFTNGCFDVLHAGHVRYLEAARALGDVLIVGLNADDSVTRLKGAGRPVNAVADRAAVLCGLASVDHVVVFHEDDPLALVREVLPDVLAKGADWKDKGVVGRDVVEARGGRVELIPLLEGRSTSATLARARASSDASPPSPAGAKPPKPSRATAARARGAGRDAR
jgi:D-beta-D-heptose 7-phosphate kinase/D-beta-D-heptose 1-phosphate adenosyltransferase